MNRAFRLSRLVAAMSLVWLACGGKIPQTHYYTLNLQAPVPQSERLDVSAVLQSIRVGKVIDQGRIVHRVSPEEVGFYEYHRWAEEPEARITSALVAALNARGTFASIEPYGPRASADYLLRGELLRLEEVDYGGPVRAACVLSLELIDTKSSKVVWAGTSTAEEEIPVSELRAVVATLSTAAQTAIDQLAGEIDGRVRSRP